MDVHGQSLGSVTVKMGLFKVRLIFLLDIIRVKYMCI